MEGTPLEEHVSRAVAHRTAQLEEALKELEEALDEMEKNVEQGREEVRVAQYVRDRAIRMARAGLWIMFAVGLVVGAIASFFLLNGGI